MLSEVLIESHLLGRFGILGVGQRHAHGEEVGGRDADGTRVGVQETADHESGAGEQDDGECHLGDHEGAGKAAAAQTGTGAAATVLESRVDVEFGEAERGDEAEEKAGADGDGGQIPEGAVVHGEIDPFGLAGGSRGGVEGADAPLGDQPAEHTAGG